MEKIWLKSYPAGVEAEIDVESITSLTDVALDAFGKFPDKVAYVSMGREMTYRELDRSSAHFAGWLQSLGLKKGDKVAIMSPNLLQYPIALFGTLRAGCVVVNCNPLYSPRELKHQLQDSEAKVIVVVENFANTLEQVLSDTAIQHVVVTSMGECLGLKGLVVNAVVRYVKKLVPKWSIPSAINLKSALKKGRIQGLSAVDIGPEDLAFLQYTGGTTGLSKGAMLSHRNMCANVMQARAWLEPMRGEGDETILTALPLYHIFALTANCITFLTFGAKNVLVVNARDIPSLIKEWSKYPVSAFSGVNTLFNALLNHPEFSALDFSTLRLSLGGGMAVQGPVAKRWQEVTGSVLLQAYGLTETSPAVTINPLNATEFNYSIGLPISSTEVVLRDDAGQDVAQGEVGELCVRGPQVMQGYWKQTEESAGVFFPDGYLRTGDMGYMDENGYVFLVDRKKDMILVSGFNVYPSEIEEIVANYPGVFEVAAIGVPDAHSGEVVKIFVVPKDDSLKESDLIAYCQKELTGYKVPKHVEFRKELPHTNVGKILRRALRDEALSGKESNK